MGGIASIAAGSSLSGLNQNGAVTGFTNQRDEL